MTHDPLCALVQPCDDETPQHGFCSRQDGTFCIHCQRWCICDIIAKVRKDERERAGIEQTVPSWEYPFSTAVTVRQS